MATWGMYHATFFFFLIILTWAISPRSAYFANQRTKHFIILFNTICLIVPKLKSNRQFVKTEVPNFKTTSQSLKRRGSVDTDLLQNLTFSVWRKESSASFLARVQCATHTPGCSLHSKLAYEFSNLYWKREMLVVTFIKQILKARNKKQFCLVTILKFILPMRPTESLFIIYHLRFFIRPNF